MFTACFPDEVAGLVLVDSSHEDQGDRFPRGPLVGRIIGNLRWQWYRLRPIAARLGWLRLWRQPNGVVEELGPELQPTARAVGLFSTAYDWLLAEGPAIEPSAALMRAAPPLPQVPLVVLSAHYRVTPPRGVSTEQLDQVWMSLQAELTRLVPDGRQIVAEKSGHFIMLDEPGLVVGAIRDVVEKARRV
jgi:pimeloyl-ACP methyl ester carboxylesterase